jgi:hypothetical protein
VVTAFFDLGRIFDELREIELESKEARGEPGVFRLKPGQKMYRYYAHGRTWYCYTPHADTRGNYYTFEYVRRGDTYEKKREVSARSRKTAKARAISRYRTALKNSQKKENR